jgi:hypothetical protein
MPLQERSISLFGLLSKQNPSLFEEPLMKLFLLAADLKNSQEVLCSRQSEKETIAHLSWRCF